MKPLHVILAVIGGAVAEALQSVFLWLLKKERIHVAVSRNSLKRKVFL